MSSKIQEENISYNKNNSQNLFSVMNIENKKILQNILDNKIRLNSKVFQDTKYSNLKKSNCNKYNKTREILETTYNVKSKDKIDWINLDYQNKLNQHGITNFECNVSYAK